MIDLPEERVRRQTALERLRQIRATVLARSQDMSPEECDALADRFSHEMIEAMVREGKIQFKMHPPTR